MSSFITVKVDVTLIDKKRLFTGKQKANGHTPQYLDLIIMPLREPGRFGDTHIVKQSCSKEERERKVEMPIIGNGTERSFGSGGGGGRPAPPAPQARHSHQPPAPPQGPDEDVPF